MRLLAAFLLAASVVAQAANPFGSSERLDAHYRKHVVEQREFADMSKQEYSAAAARLRDAPADGKTVLEKRRADGSTVRYNARTGEFGAYRGALVLTHFRPRNGRAYFGRQR